MQYEVVRVYCGRQGLIFTEARTSFSLQKYLKQVSYQCFSSLLEAKLTGYKWKKSYDTWKLTQVGAAPFLTQMCFFFLYR